MPGGFSIPNLRPHGAVAASAPSGTSLHVAECQSPTLSLPGHFVSPDGDSEPLPEGWPWVVAHVLLMSSPCCPPR